MFGIWTKVFENHIGNSLKLVECGTVDSSCSVLDISFHPWLRMPKNCLWVNTRKMPYSRKIHLESNCPGCFFLWQVYELCKLCMEKTVILFPMCGCQGCLQKTPTYAEARELQSQSVHAFAAGEASVGFFQVARKVVKPKKIGCDRPTRA